MNDIIDIGFDYSTLDDTARIEVRDAAVRIKVRMARTASDIIEIGRDLIAVKERLGHGHFLRWIEAEFNMTDRTARNFMRVTERFGGKSEMVSDFDPTVLYALSAPSTPDEVVEEVVERSADGETFTAADIKAMKDEWADEKRDLKQKLSDAKDKAKDEKASSSDLWQQVESLQKELAGLRDERDTLRHELTQRTESRVSPADAPLNDFEAKNKWLGSGMSWWNRGSKEWREEFMSIIDTPVMDAERAILEAESAQ